MSAGSRSSDTSTVYFSGTLWSSARPGLSGVDEKGRTTKKMVPLRVSQPGQRTLAQASPLLLLLGLARDQCR
jgi:hypothetical protein